MNSNALLMYSCDWLKGGLWRYAHNVGLELLKLDDTADYSFFHGRAKPENFIGLEGREKILPLSGWQKAFKLPQILQDSKFNLVHQTENSCPIFSARQNYKKIVTVHDLTPYKFSRFFSKRDYFYYRLYLPKALKTVDVIITPSENTKRELVEFYGIAENKISVIYEGLEKDFFIRHPEQEVASFLRENNISRPYILTMGINHHRNLISIFKTYASLPKAFKDRYGLVVAGFSGLETGKAIRFLGRGTKEIVRSVKELNLADNVRFLGKIGQDELVMLYQSAAVFAFPSLSEGFGFPPLEAMAAGCPVISSNASAMKETIGDSGILINPLDIDAWRESIIKVLNSESLRRELAVKGTARAGEFSWEQCAKQHLKVYYA